MRSICYGMRSHPYLLVLLPFAQRRRAFVSFCLSGFPVAIIIPKLQAWPLVDSTPCRPWEYCTRTDKLFGQRLRRPPRRTPFLRERLEPPAAAADAVTPTVRICLCATKRRGLPPHVFHKNIHGTLCFCFFRQLILLKPQEVLSRNGLTPDSAASYARSHQSHAALPQPAASLPVRCQHDIHISHYVRPS